MAFALAALGAVASETLDVRFEVIAGLLTVFAAVSRELVGLSTTEELLFVLTARLEFVVRAAEAFEEVRTAASRATLAVLVGVSVVSVVTLRSLATLVGRVASVRFATGRSAVSRTTGFSVGCVGVSRVLIGGGVAGTGVAGTGFASVTFGFGSGVGGGVAGRSSVMRFGSGVGTGVGGTMFRCGGVGSGEGLATTGVGVAWGVGDGSSITRFTVLSTFESSTGLVMVMAFAIILAP